MNKYLAECFGTFWLVLGGCGSAVLAAAFPEVGIGLLGVSLAFGLPTRPIEFDIANSVIFKGITVHGIVGRKMWSTWEHSDDLLLNKAVDLLPIVTHQYKLEEFDQAFATMESGESGKVMMWVQ